MAQREVFSTRFAMLMTMAGELLMAACEQELAVIDEKLFLKLFQERSAARRSRTRRANP